MSDFLAENNICGQTILQIVANGNAIIAELLRLKDYVPDIYRLDTKENQLKYGDVILDFSYFQVSEVQDRKIENDPLLQDLDEEIGDNYLKILTRFYEAFESIHQYAIDLKHFIDELNYGHYIQQTLESILQDEEGKQLICESLYLYGVVLLIADLHIPGIIRERLLVSYYRYSARKSHSDSNIDDVCKLLRSTTFSNNPLKRVVGYPEEYFQRVQFDEVFVEMVIGRLRSDDIYNQMSIYPMPEHRSMALANQGAMLYIILYFSPRTLNQQFSRMREIVDKFFADNWIVSFYMGLTVNLIDAWEPYKAAKAAMLNASDAVNVKDMSIVHKEMASKLIQRSRNILKEGALTEQSLLKNINKIINLLRELNVTLRWLMLHTVDPILNFCSTNKRVKQVKDQVIADSEFKSIELFEILLNTSQLELRVKDILKMLLNERQNRWLTNKTEANDRIQDLSEIFDGQKRLLTRINKNENLKVWFDEIKKEIETLDYENLNIAGRKLVQLLRALEDVQEFHNLDSNMHIKQYLTEIRQYLHEMMNTVNLKEDILINLQLIGDLSYAWKIIDKYTPIMQEEIKKQPKLVVKLRAAFLKLASALEIPLLRINQYHSPDFDSVSKYYSNELVEYVRKVVQILPETIFGILTKIIHLQTDVIKEVPTRIEKDKLKEYAQLDERFLVAKQTYSISVFTEGVLMMQKTLVGVIELDPKQLLEDGIRKELVKNISESLHCSLTFNPKAKQSELDVKLTALAKITDGYKRSFEYIQDYLNIYGLKIWQEEMLRIINYNVERECNSFLRTKIHDWESVYQSTKIPIPVYPSVDNDSITFIGRLAREILRITDPRITNYIELCTAWFDNKSHKELVNLKFTTKVNEAISSVGLMGLDKLYSFMIVTELQQIITLLQKNLFREKPWIETLDTLTKELTPLTTVVPNPSKFYMNYTQKCTKVWPKILDLVLKIGQKQILRRHIAYELNINCRFNSKNLESSLRTVNEALIVEFKAHQLDPASTPSTPKPEILFEVNKYLEAAGLHNPYHKIYITVKNSHYISLFFSLFVISHLNKMQYVKNVGTLLAKKTSDQIDAHPLVIGILTILRQFHNDVLMLFIDFLAQYTISVVHSCLSLSQELNVEAQTALYFLENFVQIAELPRKCLEKLIPEPILNQYEFLSQKI